MFTVVPVSMANEKDLLLTWVGIAMIVDLLQAAIIVEYIFMSGDAAALSWVCFSLLFLKPSPWFPPKACSQGLSFPVS